MSLLLLDLLDDLVSNLLANLATNEGDVALSSGCRRLLRGSEGKENRRREEEDEDKEKRGRRDEGPEEPRHRSLVFSSAADLRWIFETLR